MIKDIFDNIKTEIISTVKNIKDPVTYIDTYKYQNIVPYKQRCKESMHIRYKYPERVPVIINIQDLSLKLKKNKLLIPQDYTMSLAICGIRKQFILENYQAIFVFCDNMLVPNSQTIGELYENYKIKNNIKNYDDDQYLYLTLCLENTFGKIQKK
jgi:GABA(A) receptor-associated protein